MCFLLTNVAAIEITSSTTHPQVQVEHVGFPVRRQEPSEIKGPRTRVGQPKMKYWGKKCASHMSICPKILNFEQLLKHILN